MNFPRTRKYKNKYSINKKHLRYRENTDKSSNKSLIVPLEKRKAENNIQRYNN